MCYYPQLIQNRKYIPNKKNGGIVPRFDYNTNNWEEGFDKRVMAVPIGCGRCIECKNQEARKWQLRLLEETKHRNDGIFVTLTFSNESIKELVEATKRKKVQVVTPEGKLKHIWVEQELRGYEQDNEIAREGMRRFLERWRRKFKKSLRHWFITELGHNGTENIHMHGIAWTTEEAENIRKIWKYGFVWLGNEKLGKIVNYVNERTVNYIIKYVKKMDLQHREYKPKVLTSAGIGHQYTKSANVQRHVYNGTKTIEYYVTRTGHKVGMMPYWRNKIWSDDEREKLWINMLNKEIRYVGGEKVSIKDGYEEYYGVLKHYRMQNIRLGYGTKDQDWNRKKYEQERRILLLNKRMGIEEEENIPDWIRHRNKYDEYTKEWEEELYELN